MIAATSPANLLFVICFVKKYTTRLAGRIPAHRRGRARTLQGNPPTRSERATSTGLATSFGRVEGDRIEGRGRGASTAGRGTDSGRCKIAREPRGIPAWNEQMIRRDREIAQPKAFQVC